MGSPVRCRDVERDSTRLRDHRVPAFHASCGMYRQQKDILSMISLIIAMVVGP